MSNRVVLIITEGCQACMFMERIVAKAYIEAKVENTSIGVYDIQDEYLEPLLKNNVEDFPTTLFIKNGEIVDKVVGTETKDEILTKIKNLED